jgi:hypothetical protein
MCGKEVTGLSAAEPSLYNEATWVISPLPQTPAGVQALIEELAISVGARPLRRESRNSSGSGHLTMSIWR